MILITGATGTIGQALVDALSQKDVPCRLLVRDVDKARQRFGQRVELAHGDLSDRASLDRALAGVDRLFLLAPAGPEMPERESLAVAAAKQAGVSRVVYLSATGAARDSELAVTRWHAAGEAAVEASGLAWTILRPHSFMQNLLRGAAATVKREGVFYGAARDGKIAMIDAVDIAACASVALVEDGHTGTRFELTGPEALSYAEVATRIGTSRGAPVRYVDIPPQALLGALKSQGMPPWLAQDLVAMSEGFAAGNGSAVTGDVERLTGRPARALDAFLQASVGAFLP
jgi:uncharacterized protein YbjT (DUF2867 family)